VKARRVKGLDCAAPLGDNAQRIVAVRLDELCSFVPRALNPGEVEALHDMRIAAKRLRYVLEVTHPCFGPYAREAVKRAKELQDLLGDIHDCDVHVPEVLALMDRLRDDEVRMVRAGGAPAHADAWRGLNALVVHLRVRREELFGEFIAFWTQLQRDGFRARLEFAIAERPDRGTEAVAA
jgi:CHAD domain